MIHQNAKFAENLSATELAQHLLSKRGVRGGFHDPDSTRLDHIQRFSKLTLTNNDMPSQKILFRRHLRQLQQLFLRE